MGPDAAATRHAWLRGQRIPPLIWHREVAAPHPAGLPAGCRGQAWRSRKLVRLDAADADYRYRGIAPWGLRRPSAMDGGDRTRAEVTRPCCRSWPCHHTGQVVRAFVSDQA